MSSTQRCYRTHLRAFYYYELRESPAESRCRLALGIPGFGCVQLVFTCGTMRRAICAPFKVHASGPGDMRIMLGLKALANEFTPNFPKELGVCGYLDLKIGAYRLPAGSKGEARRHSYHGDRGIWSMVYTAIDSA